MVAIRQEIFTPETVAYVMQRVNEALKTQAHERGQTVANRQRLEHELNQALAELENIRGAIRKGLFSDITRQMLDEIESRVRDLRAKLDAPPTDELHVLQVLPQIIQQRLEHLERVLKGDVDQARAALRSLLGGIVLRPREAL